MSLPVGIVERYEADFESMFMWGVRITELNKEELMASLVYMFRDAKKTREEHKAEFETMAIIHRERD